MLHLDLVPQGTLTRLLLVVLTLTHLNLQHQLDLVHHFPHYHLNKVVTSIVWQHFIKLAGPNPKNPRSECKYHKNQYKCYGKKNGTLGMLQHMKVCKKRPFPRDDKQKNLSFQAKREGESGSNVLMLQNIVKGG